MHLFSNSFLQQKNNQFCKKKSKKKKQFKLFESNRNFFFFSFVFSLSFCMCFVCVWCVQIWNMNRFISANAWNGCANAWNSNVARSSADDANDSTISVISSRTAVCDDGGPGNNHYNNCTTTSSSNSNCTYLRYLFSTSSTDTTSNH